MKQQSEFIFVSDEGQIWESLEAPRQQQLVALLATLCMQYASNRFALDNENTSATSRSNGDE
jgi:hypothetical protein